MTAKCRRAAVIFLSLIHSLLFRIVLANRVTLTLKWEEDVNFLIQNGFGLRQVVGGLIQRTGEEIL